MKPKNKKAARMAASALECTKSALELSGGLAVIGVAISLSLLDRVLYKVERRVKRNEPWRWNPGPQFRGSWPKI